MSVGIIDTVIWSTSVASVFYIEVRDSHNIAGNVTVSVTKDTCSKAETTDKSFSLRAYFWICIMSELISDNLDYYH